MRPDSDIDFLVEFLPEARPGLMGLMALIDDLSDLLGRRVDMGVKSALKPRLRDGILAEARLVYAA
jgi:predicted nucleotidyltransferase